MNTLTAHPLATVKNDAYPFWSPDGKFIAYFDNRKLMKISLNEGTSLSICDAQTGRGGTWNENGIIVFAPNSTGGLYKVSSFGGTPELVVRTDSSTLSLRWPHFMPDGNHFLYSSQNSQSGSSPTDAIFVASLSDGKSQKILDLSSNVQYADGYLFFVRQSILLGQKFDPSSFKLSGDGMLVAEDLQYYDVRISGTYSVSTDGTIVYQENNPENEKVVLFDKNGNIAKNLFDKRVFFAAKFSPDGKRIVFDSYDQTEKNIDIWTYDLQRSVTTRLTFEAAGDIFAVWTPDEKQIAYSSNPNNGAFDSYIKSSDGSGQAALLLKSSYSKFAEDFSSDGKYILFTAIGFVDKNSGYDIIVKPRTGDKEPTLYLGTNFNERDAKFSPNMKWIAYSSDESGKSQVYIAPFQTGSGKWQITVDGGAFPKWMDNGRKVYFMTPDNKIMGVVVNESGSSLSPGKPYVVFSSSTPIARLFDINTPGNAILGATPNNRSIPSPITLVTNWKRQTKANQ